MPAGVFIPAGEYCDMMLAKRRREAASRRKWEKGSGALVFLIRYSC